MDFRKNPLPAELAWTPADRAEATMPGSSRRLERRAEQALVRRQMRRQHHRLEQAWKHRRLSLPDCERARRYLRGEVELAPATARYDFDVAMSPTAEIETSAAQRGVDLHLRA